MHDESGNKGRYYIVHASGESELIYSVVSSKLVTAEHTQIASGHEGETVGLMLLREFIADARTKGFQIAPLCSFVNEHCRKHPEWADVFSV
jgi:predicted GNAT family acetyltransferase